MREHNLRVPRDSFRGPYYSKLEFRHMFVRYYAGEEDPPVPEEFKS